jgi:hypothetical protein
MARGAKDGPPVVWVRFGNTTSAVLWRSLEPLLPGILMALNSGERLIEVD